MEYRYEVIADSSGKWCRNGVTYPTIALAVAGAKDLMSRWMLVREWRIVDTADDRVVADMAGESTFDDLLGGAS